VILLLVSAVPHPTHNAQQAGVKIPNFDDVMLKSRVWLRVGERFFVDLTVDGGWRVVIDRLHLASLKSSQQLPHTGNTAVLGLERVCHRWKRTGVKGVGIKHLWTCRQHLQPDVGDLLPAFISSKNTLWRDFERFFAFWNLPSFYHVNLIDSTTDSRFNFF
jgi:hypothetical protein